MELFIVILVIVAVAGYSAHHGRHYRRRRRAGLTVRESLPGPWGTRVSVSKHWGGGY